MEWGRTEHSVRHSEWPLQFTPTHSVSFTIWGFTTFERSACGQTVESVFLQGCHQPEGNSSSSFYRHPSKRNSERPIRYKVGDSVRARRSRICQFTRPVSLWDRRMTGVGITKITKYSVTSNLNSKNGMKKRTEQKFNFAFGRPWSIGSRLNIIWVFL